MVLTVMKMKFAGDANAGTSFVRDAPLGSSAIFGGAPPQERKFLAKENE
jgi:hypothetical protein